MAYAERRSCTPIIELTPHDAVKAGHMPALVIESQVEADGLAAGHPRRPRFPGVGSLEVRSSKLRQLPDSHRPTSC